MVFTGAHLDAGPRISKPRLEMVQGINVHAARSDIGPDGRATNVTIDSLNDVGLGTLKRAAE